MKARITHCFTVFSVFIAILSCTKEKDNTLRDIDGNEYATMQIGSQIWMMENLKTMRLTDGTPIEYITDSYLWKSDSSGGFTVYDNRLINKLTFGLLYNGHCIKSGMLCPKGWHIPSNEEWHILINFLVQNGHNYDQTAELNRLAKSLASTTGWNSAPDAGHIGYQPRSNNSSGFTALPAGKRDEFGLFMNLGHFTGWWSSSSQNNTHSFWYLFSDRVDIGQFEASNNNGFSVRCVK